MGMAVPPGDLPAGSWGSWASASTCSSSCSWHSTCSPRGSLSGQVWANPGTIPWHTAHDAPWSLPADTTGVGWPYHTPTPSDTALVVKSTRARRPSLVANLLKLQDIPKCHNIPRSASAPPTHAHTIDAGAFYRYYEGSVLGPSVTHVPPTAAAAHGSDNMCGGLVGGPLSSLVVAVPTKLEGFLKLFAHSLHLVLTAMCSRKARRKDRECPASTEQEHKLYLEEAVLERKIPETDLRQLVELPPGLGYEEWLASHTIDFFQHINLLYGTVCEYCTMSGCPDMTGPATRQYLWFDEKGKKTRVAAPQYVDYVMTFTQKTINDETIFPTKFENDFPVSFESIVKKIHRLLFHVLAHLYHSHFREMVLLNLHAHLNCIFAHFILFNDRFRLIDEKETEILHDLVVALKLHPESEPSTSCSSSTITSVTTSTTTTTITAATTTTTTTTSSSQIGPDCSASPNTSSSNATTTATQSTLSSEGECGDCSTSQEQQLIYPADTTIVRNNSSSGLTLVAGDTTTGDTEAGGSEPPLLDTESVPDTRP
ncbi:hypothetical protein OTU49_009660 [Cherax quadricarinatus]|uniref:MOB kinase activator-like 2 n=2 Tax=Cherax quadricarinatus TaxID=27406 RepID=A0AAW0WA15_CHEQU